MILLGLKVPHMLMPTSMCMKHFQFGPFEIKVGIYDLIAIINIGKCRTK